MKYGGPFPKVSRLKDIGGKFTVFSHRNECQESQTYYAPTGAWGKLSFFVLGGRLAKALTASLPLCLFEQVFDFAQPVARKTDVRGHARIRCCRRSSKCRQTIIHPWWTFCQALFYSYFAQIKSRILLIFCTTFLFKTLAFYISMC